MKLLIQFLCLLVAGVFSPATAYDTASTNALEELATVTNSTTIEIIDLNGCDYTSTTEAIEQQVPISDGSACPSADMSILGFFTSLSQQISSVTQELAASRSSDEASTTTVITAFNSFSGTFYILFNELDLATCTYELTTTSSTYSITFGTPNAPGIVNLQTAYNNLVEELNNCVTIALGITASNLAMQTHFDGSNFLATQVGGLEETALVACIAITTIVCVEGICSS